MHLTIDQMAGGAAPVPDMVRDSPGVFQPKRNRGAAVPPFCIVALLIEPLRHCICDA